MQLLGSPATQKDEEVPRRSAARSVTIGPWRAETSAVSKDRSQAFRCCAQTSPCRRYPRKCSSCRCGSSPPPRRACPGFRELRRYPWTCGHIDAESRPVPCLRPHRRGDAQWPAPSPTTPACSPSPMLRDAASKSTDHQRQGAKCHNVSPDDRMLRETRGRPYATGLSKLPRCIGERAKDAKWRCRDVWHRRPPPTATVTTTQSPSPSPSAPPSEPPSSPSCHDFECSRNRRRYRTRHGHHPIAMITIVSIASMVVAIIIVIVTSASVATNVEVSLSR